MSNNISTSSDADKQLAHYLAVRGCGIRAQVRQASKGPTSKRTAKQQGAGIRHARKQEFKWLFNLNGKRPPLRNTFGIP